MDLQQKIKELSAPFLSEIDAFMVDVYLGHADQQDVIQLFVDTDSGITIQQCADLNRKIGEALELQNIIQHFYVLEVSSPDVTKPLKLLRQYRKNIGRRFRVRYRKGDETGEILALVEWDSELPELPILLDEARRAADTKSLVTHEVAHAAAS